MIGIVIGVVVRLSIFHDNLYLNAHATYRDILVGSVGASLTTWIGGYAFSFVLIVIEKAASRFKNTLPMMPVIGSLVAISPYIVPLFYSNVTRFSEDEVMRAVAGFVTGIAVRATMNMG